MKTMRRSAVFLDRDGVINVNREQYVKSWEEFEFLPGALEALSLLAKTRAPIFVITNQSCIGRGLTTQHEVNRIHGNMKRVVKQHGGRIDETLVCPHTPWDGCDCRKPKPGLLLRAARDFDLDLSQSYIIGDTVTDMIAGHSAGCRTILVQTGYGAQVWQTWNQDFAPDFVGKDLLDAVQWILAQSPC